MCDTFLCGIGYVSAMEGGDKNTQSVTVFLFFLFKHQ